MFSSSSNPISIVFVRRQFFLGPYTNKGQSLPILEFDLLFIHPEYEVDTHILRYLVYLLHGILPVSRMFLLTTDLSRIRIIYVYISYIYYHIVYNILYIHIYNSIILRSIYYNTYTYIYMFIYIPWYICMYTPRSICYTRVYDMISYTLVHDMVYACGCRPCRVIAIYEYLAVHERCIGT